LTKHQKSIFSLLQVPFSWPICQPNTIGEFFETTVRPVRKSMGFPVMSVEDFSILTSGLAAL